MSADLNFNDIYEEHYDYVRKVCLRILKDESIAEDAAQDAFVNVWRKLHLFNGSAKMRTWLHRIAVNQSLMYLRRNPRIERLQLDDPVMQLLPARGVHPQYRLSLNRAVAALPDGYKTMFVMREVLGFSYPEIAEMLRCTEGTVKSQTWKAKERLRERLGDNPLQPESRLVLLSR